MLLFCPFAFFPRDENLSVLITEAASWGVETVPRVVAPRVSRGNLMRVSPLLLLDFSQPSTTLWAEEDICIFGGRGTLLLFPPDLLEETLVTPLLVGLLAERNSASLVSQ